MIINEAIITVVSAFIAVISSTAAVMTLKQTQKIKISDMRVHASTKKQRLISEFTKFEGLLSDLEQGIPAYHAAVGKFRSGSQVVWEEQLKVGRNLMEDIRAELFIERDSDFMTLDQLEAEIVQLERIGTRLDVLVNQFESRAEQLKIDLQNFRDDQRLANQKYFT